MGGGAVVRFRSAFKSEVSQSRLRLIYCGRSLATTEVALKTNPLLSNTDSIPRPKRATIRPHASVHPVELIQADTCCIGNTPTALSTNDCVPFLAILGCSGLSRSRRSCSGGCRGKNCTGSGCWGAGSLRAGSQDANLFVTIWGQLAPPNTSIAVGSNPGV